jgi:hypothetical protein
VLLPLAAGSALGVRLQLARLLLLLMLMLLLL